MSTEPGAVQPPFPGRLRAADPSHTYLSVTIGADPDDPRTDDLAGETLGAEWGLHNLDGNIALDDLVAVVAAQAQTYSG